MSIGYPLVAGSRFDASSIELTINGKRYIGAKEISYEQTLDQGEVRGFAPQVLGYTRGIYKAEGSISLFREEFADLSADLASIAAGILEAGFLCTVTYSEAQAASLPVPSASQTQIDTIVGMRLTKTSHSASSGSTDPLVVTMPFVARYILVNGQLPISNLLKVASFANQ